MDTDTSDTPNKCETSQSSKSNTKKGLNIRLEDLLAVKKAEQPDAQFWQTFDRQLEERTLRACMNKEPWYRTSIRALASALSSTITTAATAKAPSLNNFHFRMPSLSRLVTSVFACGLVAFIGLGLFMDKDALQNFASENFVRFAGVSSAVQSYEAAEAVVANEGRDTNYVLVESDGLASVEQDFAVEIITIKSRAEDYDFAADSIPVVIGDSVDYSDSAVHSNEVSNQLSARSINPYTQLASFAF